MHKQNRLHAYTTLSITQLGICRVKITHKYVEVLYSFFALPENGPPQLWMLHSEN